MFATLQRERPYIYRAVLVANMFYWVIFFLASKENEEKKGMRLLCVLQLSAGSGHVLVRARLAVTEPARFETSRSSALLRAGVPGQPTHCHQHVGRERNPFLLLKKACALG